MHSHLFPRSLLTTLFFIALAHDPDCRTCKQSIFYKTNCNFSKSCGKVRSVNLKPYRKSIVNFHNAIRQEVASGLSSSSGWTSGSNINELIYDESLENFANCLINLCEDVKHFPIVYDVAGAELSFNLDVTSKLELLLYTIDSSIMRWKDTIEHCPEYIASYQKNTECKKFTQLVWGTTASLGCSALYYKSPNLTAQKFIFACFYNPPGNRINESVYTRGFPSSDCTNGKLSLNYLSLCDNPMKTFYRTSGASKSTQNKFVWMLMVNLIINVINIYK